MKKLKSLAVFFVIAAAALCLASCREEPPANPTPESVIETFYEAWEKSDGEAIAALTCEPMWEVEAKSADVKTEELKAQIKEAYAEESGSSVYYKILSRTEYKKEDKEFKEAQKWAKERYSIEIEGYAALRVAVTYDDGEPITQTMEVIKYNNSWYAKDLLGI